VLVVDDESGFREVLTRILTAAGYEVQTATDAQDALRSIREAQPAIVFCDIRMPGRDGLWLADQVRAVSPAIAMVLCTADDTIPPMETLRDGIIAYVIKPFQRRAIVEAAANAAEWHTARSGTPVTRTKPQIDAAVPRPDPEPPPAMRRRTSRHERPRMTRSAWVAIAAVAVAAAAVGVYWRLTWQQRVVGQLAAASGVVDVSYGSGAPFAQGSGFFVAPDTFVTSLHVIQNALRATIHLPDGGTVAVTGVTAVDRHGDLALLRVSTPVSHVLTLDLDPLSIGDTVLVYGAPLGLAGTLSSGIVNAKPAADATRLQISAPISPGSSGSPVVNRSGHVVGVATAVRFQGEGLGFAVPAARLADLLTQDAETRPLIVASRGTGTDVERAQLVGDVRAVRWTHDSGERLSLMFDHDGRLIQRTDDGAGTRTEYHYDDRGHLQQEREWQGEQLVEEWTFEPSTPDGDVVEAARVDPVTPQRRRLAYDSDGRLTAEQKTSGAVTMTKRWRYDTRAWPEVGPAATADADMDLMGNVLREQRPDGSVATIDYRFDDRGNWISRVTSEGEGAARHVVDREVRTIDYW
jgi:YD repeat-containing protein